VGSCSSYTARVRAYLGAGASAAILEGIVRLMMGCEQR
jgi:hypothetical protein